MVKASLPFNVKFNQLSILGIWGDYKLKFSTVVDEAKQYLVERTLAINISACRAGEEYFPSGQFCINCTIGRFSNISGALACTGCSPGFVQSSTGKTSCQRCDYPTFQRETDFQTCATCESGRYSLYVEEKGGHLSCEQCPEFGNCDGGYVIAEAGYFIVRNKETGIVQLFSCGGSCATSTTSGITQCADDRRNSTLSDPNYLCAEVCM